jgi:hypothetical protein
VLVVPTRVAAANPGSGKLGRCGYTNNNSRKLGLAYIPLRQCPSASSISMDMIRWHGYAVCSSLELPDCQLGRRMVYWKSCSALRPRDEGSCARCCFQYLVQQTSDNRSGGLNACVSWDVHACMPTSNLHSHESQDQTMCLPMSYACADRPAVERVTTSTRATCGVYLG